jgi:inosine/xanthosine triphosphatase
MKRVVVASGNPVKIQATLNAFTRMFAPGQFEVDGVKVPSGVGAQPMSDAETLRGAEQRAAAAEEQEAQADFWVGIEGGVEESEGELLAFAWVVVRSAGFSARARSGSFVLPAPVSDLIRAGKELGEADDIVFGRRNSKQKEGALGLLTGRVIDRRELYEHAILLALVPFKSSELYSTDSSRRPLTQ